MVGDGVAIEALAVREAGAADGAFEGSGVEFCVSPIFQGQWEICMERLRGKVTLSRMVGGRSCHSSARHSEFERAILELERSRWEGHMSRLVLAWVRT